MAILGPLFSCKEFDDFIVSYLDDTLAAHQRILFQAHLAICSVCRNYLREYRQPSIWLKKLALPATKSPAKFPMSF